MTSQWLRQPQIRGKNQAAPLLKKSPNTGGTNLGGNKTGGDAKDGVAKQGKSKYTRKV